MSDILNSLRNIDVKSRETLQTLRADIDVFLRTGASQADLNEVRAYLLLVQGRSDDGFLALLKVAHRYPDRTSFALKSARKAGFSGGDRAEAVALIRALATHHIDNGDYIDLLFSLLPDESVSIAKSLNASPSTISELRALQIEKATIHLHLNGGFREAVNLWKIIPRDISFREKGRIQEAVLEAIVAVEQVHFVLSNGHSEAKKALGLRLSNYLRSNKKNVELVEILTAPDRLNLCRARGLLNAVFEDDEMLKAAGAEVIFSLASEATGTRRDNLTSSFLNQCAKLAGFWTNDEFRSEATSRALGLIRDRPQTYVTELIRARVDFTTGSLSQYESHIDALRSLSSAEGKPSGASTYMLDSDRKQAPLVLSEIISLVSRNTAVDEPVTVACADIRFFRIYGPRFAESLAELSGENPVHLHIICDESDVDEVLEFSKAHSNVSLSYEKLSINSPFYFATCRFAQLDRLAELLDRDIVVIDIDVQVTTSPQISVAKAGRPGVMFRCNDSIRKFDHQRSGMLSYDYPRLDPWATIPANYIYISRTEHGVQAAKIISDVALNALEAFGSNTGNWLIDQNVLFKAWNFIRWETDITVENVAEYGLPYRWHRPESPELRTGVGIHPVARQLAMKA
ncbi:hypothetical protein ASF70_08170 [Rhizobium sp. Leaf321]|uniref:hypothetical protein n=1 Tax=Rhizobium sp. Leaf321 TaxID=1736335 RepID=UPI000713BDEE|nr:hypothetical protein [Rhizobium sp. Leaf321]KQQ73768.1 hypothetical protein ASF70_08170 [Rhizobium sp. Leaf321]